MRQRAVRRANTLGVSLLVAVILVATACGDDAPSTFTGPIEATVTHYDYTFDLESRAAHAKVTATLTTPGDCFTLPFRAEAPANAMLDGRAAMVTVADDKLTACIADGTDAESIALEVDLTIPLQTISTSQVGYSKTVDGSSNPFYYLVSWVGGCDQFAPCDDRPNVFATYTFTVTHPDTIQVACPGVIATPSATQTTCTFDHPGGPTYSTFGVAAYPKAAWVPTDKGMWGSVHATVYARPQTLVAEAIDSAHHNAFVAYMEQNFGAFPFGGELRVYAAPTYWSGFEHPGNIVLDDSLGRATTPYTHNARHVLDHEIVHQWAGDETTLEDTYDFVWKESMAEYLAFTYEAIEEPTASDRTLAYWKSGALGAAFFPVPGEKPALFDYYGDAYGPGPMILFRQVERMSSRDSVIAGLKTLLGEPRAISVDDVVAALETSTGLDLDAYAAAWIRGMGAPVWPLVKTTYTPGSLHVQVTSGGERRCKFSVALKGANAGESQLVEVNTFTGGIDQMIAVTAPAFTVTSTELDPLRECLVYPDTTTRTARVHPWVSPRGLASTR